MTASRHLFWNKLKPDSCRNHLLSEAGSLKHLDTGYLQKFNSFFLVKQSDSKCFTVKNLSQGQEQDIGLCVCTGPIYSFSNLNEKGTQMELECVVTEEKKPC